MEEAKKPRRKGALAEAYRAGTQSLGVGGEGPRPLPRSTIEFDVDHTICLPGSFGEDFSLTLQGTTTAEEEAVGAASRDAPEKVGRLMALKMLCRFNGELIEPGQDEWLWEHLGPRGRLLVMTHVGLLSRVPEDALGKAAASVKIGG